MSSFFGPTMRGKRALQRRDDRRGVVDRQRRLRDVGELCRDRATTSRATSATDSTRYMPPSHWPIVPSTSGWPRVADHHDLAALLAHLGDLDVHLGHQRAGRVEHVEAARVGFGAHRLRHAVRGEDDRAARAAPRRAPRRTPRPSPSGRRRRTCCARPRGARRSARRTARAPARRSRWRGRRRRRSRADWRAGRRISAPSSTARRSARRWRKLSRISSAAPTVIALSATLNAGSRPALRSGTSRKSTTLPSARRSQRLPSAPPRISARPSAVQRAAAAPQAATTIERRGDDGDRGEQPALPAGRAGEEAERGAGVVREHEAEEAA